MAELVELDSTIRTVFLLKRRMIARGLNRAWTNCPKCGARLNAVLAGPKQHIHASCTTPGCFAIME